MNGFLRSALTLAGVAITAPAAAQVTFYEHDDFQGQSVTTERRIGDFSRHGFNDRASSVEVFRDRWEVCEHARFAGRCVILRPGRYPSLSAVGLNDWVSSVRIVNRNAAVGDNRFAPSPPPPDPRYDYRRSDRERLYEADVISVRAVVGAAEERCWIERQQVPQDRRQANVPAAIAGALIGGILGHQVGGGRGQDVATAGGAIAGAAVGANIGRDDGGQQEYTQNVRRCASVPNEARPDYWDVTYRFRGKEHHMQMTVPPGRTVTVNERGEPRV